MRAKFWFAHWYRPRVNGFFQGILRTAARLGHQVEPIRHYQPFNGVLVLYGMGKPEIAEYSRQHQAHGGTVLCWDVGYWGKSFRFAINGAHPTLLPEAEPHRFDEDKILLRQDWNPDGHIVLVGLGPKSRHLDHDWEQRTLRRIRETYPDRHVLYRPKPKRDYVTLTGVHTDMTSPIEAVLQGASLVVTRHSNVGVDACIAGIPVVSDFGAASLLYGSDLANPKNPDESERLDFLRRLAWFQWKDSEATRPGLWTWVRHVLSLSHTDTG